jgi:hypothetical protein
MYLVESCAQEPTNFHFTARKENPGFFSLFNSIIGALDFCEQENGYLTVDFHEDGWYYDEKKGQNWWQYYFEQPNVQVNEGHSKETIKAWQKIVFTLEAQFQMSRERAHELIKKYIKIKKPIQEKIKAFYQNDMKNFHVIGVHYRGTDKQKEAPKVSYEEFCAIVDREFIIASSFAPTKIFVATDDQNFLAFMRKKYGNSICAINAIRSDNEKAVHEELEGDNYKKGEDALIDCVLLSKCKLLIKMSSNLSDSAQMFNPALPVIHANIGYGE